MSARKPKRWEMNDSTKDTVVVQEAAYLSGRILLWCETKGFDCVMANLTPAQARLVARALLRFADGAR